jgi:hypothetical protein
MCVIHVHVNHILQSGEKKQIGYDFGISNMSKKTSF